MERLIAWGGGVWGGVALLVVQILIFLVVLLLSIAFLLYLDRKVLAAVMLRKGPNVVGPFGLLQSFADFGKFIIKEIIIPAGADRGVFILAPLAGTVLALIGWAAIPVAPGWVIADLNIGILYLFAVSALGVYGIIMGGWASNSKYPFLGGLRSAAQMVSYEVSMGLSVICALLLAGSLNLSEVVEAQAGGFWNWHVFSFDRILIAPVMLVMFVIFFVSALAETNRSPFDLPEAESELVAGYQSEYSSTPFLLYYLGEQVAIVTMCALSALLFFGGWHGPFPLEVPDILVPVVGFGFFAAKIVFFFFLFALVRALVPRYRYDQLMRLGWKVFLPLSFTGVIVVASYIVFAESAGG